MVRDLYELILEITIEGYWDWNLKSDRAYLSPRYCEMVGYSPEDTVFDSNFFKSIIHPDDRDQVFETMGKHLQGKSDVSVIEYRMISKNGIVRWIEGRGKIVEYDDLGAPARMVGTIVDISERKRADEMVSSLFSELPDLIVARFDRNLRHLYVSPSIVKITGIPSDFFIGKTNKELGMPEQMVVNWENATRKVFETGQPNHIEFTYSSPEGLKYFTSEIIPEDRIEGSITTVITTTRDITEKIKAQEALRKSEADLALAQSISHVGSWRLNILTNEVSWSDELYRVFDLEKAEFGGMYESFLDRVHPDDKLRVLETNRKTRESGEGFTVEYRIATQTGEVKYIREVGLSTKDAEGRVVELFGVAQDVTPFMEADFQKHKLEAQLFQAQKMESIGRLAGGVAHDFNNMLTVVLGNVHLGLMEVDPNQPLHAHLKEITNSAERSADLTRQLLAFARKQTIAPKAIDLNETVAGMLKMLQRLIGEDINLKWHPQENLWPVNMDPSQIDQILANLCINARDAITGVGKIAIETKNCSFGENGNISQIDVVPGDYVSISVSDDGQGMDKETLDHIFEPFYTTKEAGKGTGLGLATVYGAVKQNKGYIDVYSELGTGTTFTIYLPRYEGKTGQVLEVGAKVLPNIGHETILLVEDELAILKMISMFLAQEGYNVLMANTPSEALQLAREYGGEIHLLMTDVIMPEMNGRDLAKNLLSIYPNVKRLFMSGYTADVIAHRGVLDEGLHFIQKPFNMNAMAAKLREVLDS